MDPQDAVSAVWADACAMGPAPSAAYAACDLCPRRCGVDRPAGALGFCFSPSELRLARAALHFWEEPCISGYPDEAGKVPGSGAVFFSGCNMRCAFCQNHDIASAEIGKTVSGERLVQIFFELADQGAQNINLVTGTHYTPSVARAIDAAKEEGFKLPFVWNSSAYELPETLKLLAGRVDVYLPDFKYWSGELAGRYSAAPDYPETALNAIDEMLSQVGDPVFDGAGLMKKGVIIRHLLLPGHLEDSKRVLRHLFRRYGSHVYFSLMNQYTPMSFAPADLARPVTEREYRKLLEYADMLGIEQAFVQEGGTAKESFIPAFDYEGVEAPKA